MGEKIRNSIYKSITKKNVAILLVIIFLLIVIFEKKLGSVFDEIFRALHYLLISGVVLFVYRLTQDNIKKIGFSSTILTGLLWCVGVALLGSFFLGNPSCLEQSDPIFGDCVYYADDGYEPTMKQRVAGFAYLMTLFYVPVIFGAFIKKKE